MPRFLLLPAAFLAGLLFSAGSSFAKTDLSIIGTDITFSKDEPLEGETVRVFARVFNIGDTDVYGFVVFLDNNKEISDPQPISVKINTYDDVFIDWPVKSGSHTVQAKIIGANLSDEDSKNNTAVRNDYFVDSDTDGDKIGNIKDEDDDNDGLSDAKESIIGTDPLNSDSDSDKARDNIDPFPLDPKEWRDSDADGLGENTDADDDNDGLSDDEEVFVFGTSPVNQDSDGDGFSDKREVDDGTDPLDPRKNQASLIEAAKGLIGAGKSLPKTLAVIILPILAIILLLLRKKPR